MESELNRMKDGDKFGDLRSDQPDTFIRLFAEHSSQILGFILALSPQRSDADDIFQETSAILWEKFDTYECGTNFRAWACTVAHFVVLSHRRKKSCQHVFSDEALAAIADDALAEAESGESRNTALAKCLEKLPPGDRELIDLKYFCGRSSRQIAEAGSKSIYSVYRALSRVHGILLRCVRRTLAEDQAEAEIS